MNIVLKQTLLCCSAALMFSNVASASVVIHAQQKKPSYYQHENIANAQLVEDSLSSIVADEQYMILESSIVDTENGGENSHLITVFGLTSGSSDSAIIIYDVIVNDYEQDVVPNYVLNSTISGNELLDDADINIYSPSTVTLNGESLDKNIDTSVNIGSYSSELIVDGNKVADVKYNIEYGNNIIVTPGTNIPLYALNQSVTAEQLFVDSGSTVDSSEEVIIVGTVSTAQVGKHTAMLNVIGLVTGSNESINIDYTIN